MDTPRYTECNCGDSALSTIANILSILTFAYVLLVGSLYQYALHQRTQSTKSWTEMRMQAAQLQDAYSRLVQKETGLSFMQSQFAGLNTDVAKIINEIEHAETHGSKWHVVWRGMQERQTKLKLQDRLALSQEMLNGLRQM
jgi:hypothetical protein